MGIKRPFLLYPAIAGGHQTSDTMGDAVNGATSWAFGLFTNRVVDAVLGTKTSRASMETDPVSRVEAKRRRSPVMEIDDESPQTKRVRRSSPPGVTGRMQTEPPSNHRRAGSVKALVCRFPEFVPSFFLFLAGLQRCPRPWKAQESIVFHAF